jgi:hypothetical protein
LKFPAMEFAAVVREKRIRRLLKSHLEHPCRMLSASRQSVKLRILQFQTV